jgi:hypothetical protein
MIAQKHDIRPADVELVAITNIPELYKYWCPNKRKEKDGKRVSAEV